MKTIDWKLSMTLAGLVVGLAVGTTSLAAKPNNKVPIRVGTYDSRSVAVAYAGSPKHEAEIRRLDEALEKAKKEGDAQQI